MVEEQSKVTVQKSNFGIVKLMLIWFAGPMIPLTFTLGLFPYLGLFCTLLGGVLVGLITSARFNRWFYSAFNGIAFSGFILALNGLLGQTGIARFSLAHSFFEPRLVAIAWLHLAGFLGGFAGFGVYQLFSEQIDGIGAKISNVRSGLKSKLVGFFKGDGK